MGKLIAVAHILYLSKQYKPGQELPQNDQNMVNLWVEAGTAKMVDEEEKSMKTVKAKSVTAPVGRTGKSIPKTSEDDLTGKVTRKKK